MRNGSLNQLFYLPVFIFSAVKWIHLLSVTLGGFSRLYQIEWQFWVPYYTTYSQSNPVTGPFFDLHIFRTPEGLLAYHHVYGAVMTTGHQVVHWLRQWWYTDLWTSPSNCWCHSDIVLNYKTQQKRAAPPCGQERTLGETGNFCKDEGNCSHHPASIVIN